MIAFDLESTGTSVYMSEIITGFFLNMDNGEFYEFESQVNNWCEEASKVHKIKKEDMHKYPQKDYAYQELLNWLPESFDALIYSNPRTQDGFIHFDIGLLKSEIMNHLKVDRIEDLPFKINVVNVHALAKECASLGLFEPMTGGKCFELGILTDEKYKGSNRTQYRMESVYYVLFGYKHNAHDARSDVMAMVKIYNELLDRKKHGKVNKDQLSLL